MSTYNIYFHGEIRKVSVVYSLVKKPLCRSMGMYLTPTILWSISADNKLVIFVIVFHIFPRK